MKRIALALLIFYVAGGIFLYFFQEVFLFHPQVLPQEHRFSFDRPFTEHRIKDTEGNILHFVKFTSPNRKGIVLYFHGNKKNVERFAKFSEIFTKNGYEVWMPDYRGYGKSTGKNSEKIMYDDAFAVYQFARKEVAGNNIIVYGKSLGTGVAAHLVAHHPCKMLLLETPYYSMKEMAQQWMPIYPSALMRYKFPTNKFLKKISVPITIFHGTADGIINYRQSEKIKKENLKVDLVTIDGGTHNNLADFPRYQQALIERLSN